MFSAVIVQLLNFNHKPVALSYAFLVVCNGGVALTVVYPVPCLPGNRQLFRNLARSHCRNQGLKLVLG